MKAFYSSFSILFAASLFAQIKPSLTTSQLASLLIKINEFTPENIIDAPVELIQMVSKKCGFSAPLHNLNTHQAKEKAVQWLKNDISVLCSDKELLFIQGNGEIFNSSTAAVLNSRKIRAVIPDTRWFRVTINLTEEAITKGFTIVSSLGILTYEVVTFIASKHQTPLIIVLDGYLPGMLSSELQKAFYDKFSHIFDLKNTLFVSPFCQGISLPTRRERLARRDYWVVGIAKYLFVGEARLDGNIHKLSLKALSEGRKVGVFRPTKFDKSTKGNQKLLLAGGEEVICDGASFLLPTQPYLGQSPQQVEDFNIFRHRSTNLFGRNLSEYLFHYTRACPGPWPGQSLAEYLQSLINGYPCAGHTAFDTLCRILKEQLIRASNRLVRGKIPLVSFTSCLPDELAKIRKWNSALIRWTFEPYGIGIRKNILKEMGAQPVIYTSETEFRILPEDDKFRFQPHQPPKIDWSLEKEWRIPANVSLNHLSPEDMVIVVSTPEESAIINKDFSTPVILASSSGKLHY